VQAFQDLIGQLLGESDAQLSSWKKEILQALGDAGQVIIDVIPEVEQIIGKQTAAPELSGTAAQNRFDLLFQKFIQVFTSEDHPLVIFLDDLQWADSASLKLIKLLMCDSQADYLLMIGAYRDNEVFPAHPLILMFAEMQKKGIKINTIILEALSKTSLTQLVADTLSCSVQIAQPLADFVHQKTQGNPFFTTQFLKALYQDGLIRFDAQAVRWQCDITKVRSAALTDDVVEFMMQQLQKLPVETQEILQLAACIGNQFDLKTLAIASEKSEAGVAVALWQAIQPGLILPQSEEYKFYLSHDESSFSTESVGNVTYRFLHDRVQQAAYSLIPDDQKQTTHYQIGQLLLQTITKENSYDRIFEVVNQLNYGSNLVTEQTERDKLAQLNLIACHKARAATAIQAAREYASAGLSLLGENAWQRQYDMNLAFHDDLAELAMLCGDFKAMEQFIDAVIEQGRSLFEKVNVYRIRIQSNISQNKITYSISIAQEFLQQLGVTFPETPTLDDIQQAVAEIENIIGGREIEDFANLPWMSDRKKIAIAQITNSIMPATFVSGSPLFPLLASLSVKLSIQYGNTPASAKGYVCYGVIACNLKQDVETGVKFGQLALQVVSKLDGKIVQPEVFVGVGSSILHRKSHIQKTLTLLQKGYTVGLEVGNLEYAGYSADLFCLNSFWCGQPLVILEQETRAYCNGLVQLNQLATANHCRICWQPILNLLGCGQHPDVFSGEALQEKEFLPLLLSANDLYGLHFFHLYKLMLCYLFGKIDQAQNHTVEARRYLIGAAGLVGEPAFYFYDSLTVLRKLSSQSEDTSELLQRVAQNQAQLSHWARYAPMNHQHKVDLVEAEKFRVLGRNYEAGDLYDRAISGAKENSYIQEEALANELAGKFYLDWGKQKIATGYMQEAYYCYANWGAKAKVAHLEQDYPQLLAAILQPGCLTISTDATIASTLKGSVSNASNSQNFWLDFVAVMKAAQAISGEIELEQLLATLMQIVIASAGAQIACLILRQESQWFVVARTNKDGVQTSEIPLEQYQEIPQSLIYSVARNGSAAVFEKLSDEAKFASDNYVITYQPKSVLCTPISQQGKLIGILYLENNLTVGAFTSDRLEVIQILTTQAAISLENAQLYRQSEEYSRTLEQKVEQRTQELTQKAIQLESTLKELQRTQTQLVQSEKMSSLGQLVAGVAHEINNPVSFIHGNLDHVEGYTQDLLQLANLHRQSNINQSEIQELLDEIDVEFIQQDLPKTLKSMKVGTERIRDIVLSLRNFSRMDEAEFKKVDIHAGINSTLMILQNCLQEKPERPAIEIIQDYGTIPVIECYAGELNQAFLNILTNAIDAIEEKNRQKTFVEIEAKPNQITIRTSVIDTSWVEIVIADNGIGMTSEIQKQIFNPFFTTKPVGSGTGMGLSISYQIITEKHRGKLTCFSTLYQGTQFVIQMPMNQSNYQMTT
jgi:predicted ATPase/signal transduction histidine kinase